ncbi:hypothetical protein JVU11DRAFT_7678 [Chiua virens]|nr:hypothetical protein JVU11DRAFT_7678 [Chiua virens]
MKEDQIIPSLPSKSSFGPVLNLLARQQNSAWDSMISPSSRPKHRFKVSLWPYEFTPAGTALASFVTQIYLGFRIWRLTGSMFLYGVVISLAIPSFVLGLACSIGATIIKVMAELPDITSLAIAWLSMQVIADTFITITLIIIFVRWRGGFRKTDLILNQLIRGAVQTGLFAVIFSLGDLVTFVVCPNTNLYGMFAIPVGRIYTNTLLDTLLTRESIKAEMVTTNGSSGRNPMSWLHSNTDSSRTTDSTPPQTIQLVTIRDSDIPEPPPDEQAQSKLVALVV